MSKALLCKTVLYIFSIDDRVEHTTLLSLPPTLTILGKIWTTLLSIDGSMSLIATCIVFLQRISSHRITGLNDLLAATFYVVLEAEVLSPGHTAMTQSKVNCSGQLVVISAITRAAVQRQSHCPSFHQLSMLPSLWECKCNQSKLCGYIMCTYMCIHCGGRSKMVRTVCRPRKWKATGTIANYDFEVLTATVEAGKECRGCPLWLCQPEFPGTHMTRAFFWWA